MSEHKTDGFATYVAMELRAECARKRLSGRELAHHIHRPVTTVSRWLNGSTPIAVDDLARVCESIGVGVAEIAQRAEVLMHATRATQLAAGRTPPDQVPYVTKRYRTYHQRDLRPLMSRSAIGRSPTAVSAKRAESGIAPYRAANRYHKLAS